MVTVTFDLNHSNQLKFSLGSHSYIGKVHNFLKKASYLESICSIVFESHRLQSHHITGTALLFPLVVID